MNYGENRRYIPSRAGISATNCPKKEQLVDDLLSGRGPKISKPEERVHELKTHRVTKPSFYTKVKTP